MSMTIEERNQMVRRAVEGRMEAQAAGKPHEEWYDVSQPVTEPMPEVAKAEVLQHVSRGPSAAEVLERFAPAITAAEETLRHAVAAVRDRHGKYGPPTQHFARTAALVNAAFGTTFTAADWALVMVLDKVARQLGPQATDDAAIDIAGYAACHQECRRV